MFGHATKSVRVRLLLVVMITTFAALAMAGVALIRLYGGRREGAREGG